MLATLGAYGSLQRRPSGPFERHLCAENKSARTVQTYLEAVQQLDAFLTVRDVELADAGREDLETFLAGLLAACAACDFEARRDRALILLLLDTGGRLAEIAGMRLGDMTSSTAWWSWSARRPRARATVWQPDRRR